MNDQEFMDEWYEGLSDSRKVHMEHFHQHHLDLRKCFGRMFNVIVDDNGQIYTNREWAEKQHLGSEPSK